MGKTSRPSDLTPEQLPSMSRFAWEAKMASGPSRVCRLVEAMLAPTKVLVGSTKETAMRLVFGKPKNASTRLKPSPQANKYSG